MKQSTLTMEKNFEAMCLIVASGLCIAPVIALVTFIIGGAC